MKETGLMFKAPLVRAILSGKKTQTRRLFKAPNGGVWPNPNDKPGMAQILRSCPLGQPGDRIYVRETWCQQADDDGFLVDGAYWYRSTDPDVMDSEDMEKSPWRPSIHMPKVAARLWLVVTGVRVEHLHDISEADASREGPAYSTEQMGHWCGNGRDWQMTARQAFRDLWIETGGDWAANPWVWVINFKRIEMPQGSAA